MIDFRYHLVSLISVFLALAVGIVLGAGPLKEAIGDTLTGEVDQLRSSAADLRSELDQVQTELDQSEKAFAAAAPALLAGTLDGRRIAIIEIGNASDGVVQDVAERIAQAGATVSATVHVTDEWTDPARSSYRRALAGSLVEYLDPTPAVDAGTSQELAEALIQGLTTADPLVSQGIGQDAALMLQFLEEGRLVEISEDVTEPADAVVILVGQDADTPEDEPTAESTVEPTEEELALLRNSEEVVVDLARVADDRSEGVVVGASGLAGDGVLQRLRSDESTRRAISTVAYIQSLVGSVSVPLALAENMTGQAGHYGPDGDATAPVPPRVELPPAVPVLPPVDGVVDPDAPPTDVPAPPTDGPTAPSGDGTGTGTEG